jgi:proline dehydrogenase
MLRSLLIYLSKAAWAQKLVTSWGFAWRAASRFVAGEKIEDAIRAVCALNEKGINATLDHLGEHTSKTEEAEKATDDVLLILDEIDKAGARANVSIKLTQIGMGLDEEICRHNLVRIMEQGTGQEARELCAYRHGRYALYGCNLIFVLLNASAWIQRQPGGHGCSGLSIPHRSRPAQAA